MTWHKFLIEERAEKLGRIEMLSSGKVQMHMTTNGVRRDVTQEQVEDLKNHVAEIEAILNEAGVPFDA